MRNLLLLILTIVLFFSCTAPHPTKLPVGLLAADSLPTQNFSIDINKDTLLHTINGTWLKIDKGTFSSDNGTAVLEIKEAMSMQQIIKAGLVTQSNGQPLASGGMIFINAAAGQKITINKPFKVAVPSAFLDKNMQLYKGEKTADGTIDWKDPKALDSNSQMNAFEKGEILFQQKCASCHGIGKEGSGPDLANFGKRFPEIFGEGNYVPEHYFKKQYIPYSIEGNADTGKAIYHYDEVWSDPYICNLITLFGNKEIDLSGDFNKNHRDWVKIYNYIENESNRRNLPYPSHAYLNASLDSCNLYKRLKAELEIKRSKTEAERKRLISENGSLVREKEQLPQQQNNMPPLSFTTNTSSSKDKVIPQDYTATYYEFTIETFGWYNIDVLLKENDNIKESELFVKIIGAYREKITVYLIIPSMKVMLDGGPTEKNKDEYAFYKKDGTIPLPQNTKAYILAFTETDKAIAYSVKEFLPQLKQSFEISLTESSKHEFSTAIDNIGAKGLSINVGDAKNAKAIRDTDKTIEQLQEELKNAEKLKPKRCDCDCGVNKLAAAPMAGSAEQYEDAVSTVPIVEVEL